MTSGFAFRTLSKMGAGYVISSLDFVVSDLVVSLCAYVQNLETDYRCTVHVTGGKDYRQCNPRVSTSQYHDLLLPN